MYRQLGAGRGHGSRHRLAACWPRLLPEVGDCRNVRLRQPRARGSDRGGKVPGAARDGDRTGRGGEGSPGAR